MAAGCAHWHLLALLSKPLIYCLWWASPVSFNQNRYSDRPIRNIERTKALKKAVVLVLHVREPAKLNHPILNVRVFGVRQHKKATLPEEAPMRSETTTQKAVEHEVTFVDWDEQERKLRAFRLEFRPFNLLPYSWD